MSVTIGPKSYQSYATIAQADNYLAADFNASAWQAGEDDDAKGRALVSATRVLERQSWIGDKAESDQDLAWPRTGTGIDGVEDDEIPADIVSASIELANIIFTGTDVANTTQEQSTKRQKAGSVEIEYFRSFDDPSRFPRTVQELISKYLAGSGYSGVITSGTDSCSTFDTNFAPTRAL